MREVLNMIAERYVSVIQYSEADKYDFNLQFDVVGVLVDQGFNIKEELPVEWKNQVFKVSVTEMEESWIPGCIIKKKSGDHGGTRKPRHKQSRDKRTL
ncbi:hypothetical protein Hanom_Chr16g01472621 [Helianthus anomalus]